MQHILNSIFLNFSSSNHIEPKKNAVEYIHLSFNFIISLCIFIYLEHWKKLTRLLGIIGSINISFVQVKHVYLESIQQYHVTVTDNVTATFILNFIHDELKCKKIKYIQILTRRYVQIYGLHTVELFFGKNSFIRFICIKSKGQRMCTTALIIAEH